MPLPPPLVSPCGKKLRQKYFDFRNETRESTYGYGGGFCTRLHLRNFYLFSFDHSWQFRRLSLKRDPYSLLFSVLTILGPRTKLFLAYCRSKTVVLVFAAWDWSRTQFPRISRKNNISIFLTCMFDFRKQKIAYFFGNRFMLAIRKLL